MFADLTALSVVWLCCVLYAVLYALLCCVLCCLCAVSGWFDAGAFLYMITHPYVRLMERRNALARREVSDGTQPAVCVCSVCVCVQCVCVCVCVRLF